MWNGMYYHIVVPARPVSEIPCEVFVMSYFSDPGLIELVFVYSIALGLGVWQLIAIRRTRARTRAAGQPTTDKRPVDPTA